MRLIDADALREDVKGLHMTVTGLRAGKGALAVYAMKYRNSLDRLIDEASTIDAVPVVRCGECKWRDTPGCLYVRAKAAKRDDNDYCSDGERREVDGE